MSAYEVVDAHYVEEHIGKMPLVDVRPTLRFDTGYIPTAVNIRLDVAQMTDDAGAELAEMFQDHGIGQHDAAIVYCQCGPHAKMACELLAEQGYDQLRLYQGSMDDWIKDPARPVETAGESFVK